jgi:hypothetical protein
MLEVRGNTMHVVNPRYVREVQRRNELLRAQQLQARVVASASTWISQAQRLPAHGCFTRPTLFDEFELTETQVATILDAGTYVYKPPFVREERNADIRRALLSMLTFETHKDLYETLVAEETTKGGANVPLIKEHIERVLVRFTEAVVHYDWADTALTGDELKEQFDAYLAAQATALTSSFRLGNVDERELYARETVEAAPVARMFDWFKEFRDLGGYSATIYEKLARAVRALLYDDAGSLLADVAARDETLRPNTWRKTQFGDTVAKAIRLEATIHGLGAIPPGVDVAALRLEQELSAAALNPTEENARVRHFRLLDVTRGLLRESEARLARLDEVIRVGFKPTIEVPLVEERSLFDQEPLVLEIELVSSDGAAAELKRVDVVWYRRNFDESNTLVYLESSAENVRTPATFQLSLSEKDDDIAAMYYAGVTIDGAGDELVSATATVRVFATCVRCDGARFEVGVRRNFGECTWRAHPETAMGRVARNALSVESAHLGLVTMPNGYRAELDDSIVSADGLILLDEASIANLSMLRPEALRERYFTYESMLARLAIVRAPAFAEPSPLLERLGIVTKKHRRLLSDAFVAAATDAQLPVIAVIVLVLGAKHDVGQSVRRFFGMLATRMAAFVRMYRYVNAFEANEDEVMAEVARMTMVDVQSSLAWRSEVRALHMLGNVTPTNMFVDEVGERRLRARIDAVMARYDYERERARYAERNYSSMLSQTSIELETQAELAQPFGVPLAVWERMRYLQQHAALAKERITSAPLFLADWLGEHSADDTQPSMAAITYDEDGTMVLERGSQRLRSGYDFAGLHELIVEAVRAYNANKGDVDRRARAERLVLYFNVLAQFAPPLEAGHVASSRTIVEHQSKRQRRPAGSFPVLERTVVRSAATKDELAQLVAALDAKM